MEADQIAQMALSIVTDNVVGLILDDYECEHDKPMPQKKAAKLEDKIFAEVTKKSCAAALAAAEAVLQNAWDPHQWWEARSAAILAAEDILEKEAA
jgi:hypothetical protein